MIMIMEKSLVTPNLLPKNKNMLNVYAKKIAKTYSKIGYKKDKKSDLMFKVNQEIY